MQMYRSNNKDRFLRSLYTFIAVIALLLNLYSFYTTNYLFRMTTDDCLWSPVSYSQSEMIGFRISNVISGGVSEAAGLKNNDILIALNGVQFRTYNDGMAILNQYSDEDVIYTVIRDNSIIDLHVRVYKLFNVLFNTLWMMGMGFLIFGFIVGYSKPQELTAKLFYLIGITSSLGLILYSDMRIFNFYDAAAQSYPFGIINRIYFTLGFISVIFISSIFFHFFLSYPLRREFRHRRKIIIAVYCIPVIAVTAGIVYNLILHRYIFYLSRIISEVLPMIITITGVIIFIDSIRKIKDNNLKKSVLIIRNGFLIGAVGFAYYLIFLLAFPKPYFLFKPLEFTPIILVLAIPFSFGYSIIKYRILDTEYIIKKSIVLGIVSFMILAVYLFMVFLLNRFAGEYFENSKQLFIIAFIIIATFTFDYVNNKSVELVDRLFYREKYNYRKSLLKFSGEISFISDFNEIISRTKNEIFSSIGIDIMKLCITNKRYEDVAEVPALIDCDDKDRKYIDEIHLKLFRNNAEPVVLYPAFFRELNLTDEETAFILSHKIKLSIPLFYENKFLGSLNFGEKNSGKEFSDEDIDLLKTIAYQISVSLENSRLRQIEYKNRIIDEELKIAKDIQTGLLPDFEINRDKYRIKGLSIPSRVIGGDFFDIIDLGNDKILTVVADVSGKGIPAAIYMAKIQSMIQFASELFLSPRELLIEINRQIYEQMDRKFFITALIGLFDFKNGTLTTARAGHLPLSIYNASGHNRILSKGIGIGLESGRIFESNLEESITKIEPDTVYFLYTDGVNEAMNMNNEEYGFERMNNLILNNRQLDINSLESFIIKDIENFRGQAEQNDDITFVIIKT
jgi:serine phosphatase RsbU (regulator of sigma subunit)